MRIKQLLENYEDNEVDAEIVKAIAESEFFKLNYKNDLLRHKDMMLRSFLNDRSDKNLFLWRGRNSDAAEIINQRSVRVPRDTARYIHDYVNEYSIAQLGFPIRSALMMFLDSKATIGYGKNTHAVFPIGTYGLYYNPTVRDFTDSYGLSYDTSSRFEDGFRASLITVIMQKLSSYKEFRTRTGDVQVIMSWCIDDVEILRGTMDEVRSDIRSRVMRLALDAANLLDLDDDEAIEDTKESIFNDLYQSAKDVLPNELKRLASNYVDGMESVKKTDEIERMSAEILLRSETFALIPEDQMIAYMGAIVQYYNSKK